MDVSRALSYVFEDEEWMTKLLIGTAILLIPFFGGMVIMGYAIAIIRNVTSNHPRPLPAWDNIGGFFMDGLMFWVASLIYAIPMFVLICPTVVVWGLPILAGENQDLAGILAGVSGLVAAGLGCLALLYGILLALLTPVLQIRYAEYGEIGACLRLGEVFRFLGANIGSIIIANVLMWAAGVVIGSVVGVLSLVVGWIPFCGQILMLLIGLLMLPVGVWLNLFSAHLYGQIGRQAGASPLAA